MSIPAVFPGRPDVFQFVVSHVFYGEHKHVSVDVCTFTQLRGGETQKDVLINHKTIVMLLILHLGLEISNQLY